MSERYLIISGTNRAGSNTYKVALEYQRILSEHQIESSVISLESLPVEKRNAKFTELEKEKLIPADKYIFISPEYNGSIPGVLKSMFDISDYKNVWWGKKALLVGISTGRSGNVRGMEHLTSILNYLKVVVHPNKLPISSVDLMLNGTDTIHDRGTIKAIKTQLQEFIDF
jgi:chromate reductase, NAD(P)H dehydrogenase (quinone)